jgi:ketopantoate hydroxymethyltransferase
VVAGPRRCHGGTDSEDFSCPTIGIGGSPAGDGQILVVDEIRAAAREYADEGRQRRFPDARC